jgi:hypothetical protein
MHPLEERLRSKQYRSIEQNMLAGTYCTEQHQLQGRRAGPTTGGHDRRPSPDTTRLFKRIDSSSAHQAARLSACSTCWAGDCSAQQRTDADAAGCQTHPSASSTWHAAAGSAASPVRAPPGPRPNVQDRQEARGSGPVAIRPSERLAVKAFRKGNPS